MCTVQNILCCFSATGTVNLANMDNINYVVSGNSSSVSSAATKTTFTLDVAGSTATATDTVTFNGGTYAFTGGMIPVFGVKIPAIATASVFGILLNGLLSIGKSKKKPE